MLAQLVYIHCEKSAGTSQRSLFVKNYGREKIFWHGLDHKKYPDGSYKDIENYLIFGGHISYLDLTSISNRCLFTSVIREPISRAVSLYHYFCENAPEEQRLQWIEKGLDKTSMLRTIEKVPGFRKQITNMQCYRLSGKKDFDMTREILSTDNFLVGHFGNLEAFNARLGEILDWKHTSLGQHNTAKRSDYQSEILSEPHLRDLILELNQEDAKLYEFIVTEGLYEHLPDEDIFRKYLSTSTSSEEEQDTKANVIDVQITASNERPIEIPEEKHISIHLNNKGNVPLQASGENPIIIAYHWYDQNGQLLEREGARTRLPKNIFPGESIEINATLRPPKSLPDGDYVIRFGLLKLGVRWLKINDDNITPVNIHFSSESSQ